jgi:long-chain acyl-CoA synthetase
VSNANRQLEPHQRIRSWTIWNQPDFPRTNLLKVRREQLRERAALELSSNEGGVTSSLTLGLIVRTPDRKRSLEMLAQYLCEAHPSAASEESAHLVADFGVSSLDTVVLSALVEQRRNRFIDRIMVGAATTVADLRSQIELTGNVNEALPVRQPIWSETVLAGALRRMVSPVVVKVWSALGQRVTAIWHTNPEKLAPPFLLAAAPHKHWRDAFAIACAMPGHISRRMVVVTNRDFGEYFDRARGASAYERLKIASAYYVGLPLVFPFTVVHPSRGTRDGLLETSRYIDRGFCPLTFPKGIHFGRVDYTRHDPGTALLALECGVPVLPIVLENNDDWTHWPRRCSKDLRVHLLPPVVPAPGLSVGEFAGLLEQSLAISIPAVY